MYPSTVLCGGGQVALAWKINNPRGKNCTITTDTIKPVSAYPAALQSSVTSGIQAIKSKLDGSNIVIKIVLKLYLDSLQRPHLGLLTRRITTRPRYHVYRYVIRPSSYYLATIKAQPRQLQLKPELLFAKVNNNY